jgi:hypothetical protein
MKGDMIEHVDYIFYSLAIAISGKVSDSLKL